MKFDESDLDTVDKEKNDEGITYEGEKENSKEKTGSDDPTKQTFEVEKLKFKANHPPELVVGNLMACI